MLAMTGPRSNFAVTPAALDERLKRKALVEELLLQAAIARGHTDSDMAYMSGVTLRDLIIDCLKRAAATRFRGQGRQTLGYPGQSGPDIVRTPWELAQIDMWGEERGEEREIITHRKDGYAAERHFLEVASWTRWVRKSDGDSERLNRNVVYEVARGTTIAELARRNDVSRQALSRRYHDAMEQIESGVKAVLRQRSA